MAEDTTHHPTTRQAATGCLIVASIVTTGTVVALALQGSAPKATMPELVRDALIALTVAVWMIWIVRSAEERCMHRLDEIEAVLTERLHGAEYAEGYVDGVERRTPEKQRVLRSV